jgi:hypothetical protein
MNGLTTLGNVWDRVQNLSQNCFDLEVPVSDLSFENLDAVKIAGEEHCLRTIAQQGMAYRLGIPINYLRKCPPDLQAIQLNHWIKEEKNEDLFFRFDGLEVRAIFTPRYTPVDNIEVMNRLNGLGYEAETQVQCSLDAEFMSLSIPDGSRTFGVNGDNITPGISVSNSEVGLASLTISAFFLRLVCTNGLIAKTNVSNSFRHVSTKVLEKFPEVIGEVGGELERKRGQFRLSMESPVAEPYSTIMSFNRQFQVGKPEQDAVDWGFLQEPGETLFHIVNAYTRAAQYSGLSAESSFRLQRIGGQILGMVR